MKRLVLIAMLSVGVLAKAQTFDAGGNGPAVAMDAVDRFNYLGKPVAHYGLGWYSEAMSIPPYMYMSGFAGIKLFTWGEARMIIDGSGKVGIGTLNPESKLHLQDGSVFIKTLRAGSNSEYPLISGTQAVNGTSGHAGIYLYEDGSGGFGQASGLAFKVSVNDASPATALLIKANGNIGIGTDTPNEKLSVNGKIRAKEIKVEATNWPDYVFEEGYKVGKLEELESYIKANKHLPDMPAAREIATNGLELGEMVRLQQQKIEELTLHLIDKDKALKKVELENTQLKAKQVEQDTAIKKMIERIDKIELKKP
ncbi:hypothetical protein HDC90_004524 [Pedobacter sp. AK013]|uniref:tail fiber protein n=1 Tax=Pedobacter sp. AK013 TaxID=2723071 RepID=UPI0016111DC0|nr:tail fiber protein [Pedobacter sp. AK013]MBB6239862.1 hypothetical protein [Pedobacter sp. AK013]